MKTEPISPTIGCGANLPSYHKNLRKSSVLNFSSNNYHQNLQTPTTTSGSFSYKSQSPKFSNKNSLVSSTTIATPIK